jgi:hypothetical protein
VTCCKNPGFRTLQVGINSSLRIPDQLMSSIEPAFVELQLVNAYLDSLFPATNEYIESLRDFEQRYRSTISIADLKRRPNEIDITSFVNLTALARLGSGIYTDGYDSGTVNASVKLNADHLDNSYENTYLYPHYPSREINSNNPVMIIQSVVFLRITPLSQNSGGVLVISSDDVKAMMGV